MAGFWPRQCLQPLHNLPDADIERDGDNLQRAEGHALLPAFEPIEVGPVEPGEFRKLILGDPLSLADFSDAFPDCSVDVLQATRLGGMLLLGTLLKSNMPLPLWRARELRWRMSRSGGTID